MNTIRKQAGFTLIELMIVIAIIAILAAIAIPAYQDYTIRAQVSEGANIVSSAKLTVAAFRDENGTWPSSNASAGLAAAASINGEFVTGVAISGNGIITATYGNNANPKISGDTLVFTPTDEGGSISWDCATTTSVEAKFLPSQCRP